MNEAAQVEARADAVPIIDASRIRLTVLKQDEAIGNWEIIAPYLDRVFQYSAGRIDIEGTLELVKRDLAEVLLVWDPERKLIFAVIVAEAKRYPKRHVYSLGLCEGFHLNLWAKRIWPALLGVAKAKGYDQLEVVGRRGWGRFLEGAREVATFYAIDLDDEETEDG